MQLHVGGQLLDSLTHNSTPGTHDKRLDRGNRKDGTPNQDQRVCGGRAQMLMRKWRV